MHYLWDYDKKTLEKTERGRILILERMINYGPGKDEKIKLALVKLTVSLSGRNKTNCQLSF